MNKLWKLIERKKHDFISGLFMFLSPIQPIKEKFFKSCDIVVCVVLELHPRFLQTWIFFWRFLKGIVDQLWKWVLKCNHIEIRNSWTYIFFVKPGSKNGISVYQWLFLCKLRWFTQCGFLLGFSICLQDHAEFKTCSSY